MNDGKIDTISQGAEDAGHRILIQPKRHRVDLNDRTPPADAGPTAAASEPANG